VDPRRVERFMSVYAQLSTGSETDRDDRQTILSVGS